MEKRLLLWDIDSTLIDSGHAGVKALQRVVELRYGAQDDFSDLEIAGRTDSGIVRSILGKYGVGLTSGNVDGFLEEYLALLPEFLHQPDGHVLPGVVKILQYLQRRPDRVLALLTGNLERGAKLKLGHYGLWDYFEFGAFADDHHDRNELGAFARARAREKHGEDFAVARIDVIGDTGHDIACGRIFGARTIAVATGSWSRERLAKERPDFLFDDLSDTEEVIAQLGW